MKVSVSGGTPIELAAESAPVIDLVGGLGLYWMREGALRRLSL